MTDEKAPKRTVRQGRVKHDGQISWTEAGLEKAGSMFGSVMNWDGWGNVLTGLGDSSRDKRLSNRFSGSNRITQSQNELEELYDGDDIVGTYVDLPAEEMTREWITLAVADKGDRAREIETNTMQRLEELSAQEIFMEAVAMSRLYGGSAIFMSIQDGRGTQRPVNENKIRSISWLKAFDRWDLIVEEKYDDPLHPKFRHPKIYRVQNSEGASALIHESRMLRFDGVKVSSRRRLENQGWGNSILERTMSVIRDFQAASDGVAHLLQDFSQAVFKIKGLAKAIAADKDNLVRKRLQLLDMGRSLVRAVPLDAEAEEFERKGAAVSGMAELYDRQMMRVSAATRMPVTLLFGRSAAGQNATGEGDIRLFYDRIRAAQTVRLRPHIERLIKLMMLAADGPSNGVEPEAWKFKFNPLHQPTEKEQGETRLMNAKADDIYIRSRVVAPREVRKSRFGKDGYSAETTLDEDAQVANELAQPIEPPGSTGPQPKTPAEEEKLADEL